MSVHVECMRVQVSVCLCMFGPIQSHLKSGSLLSISWTADGTQLAATGGNGGVVFGSVVDIGLEDGRVRVVVTGEKRVVVQVRGLYVCVCVSVCVCSRAVPTRPQGKPTNYSRVSACLRVCVHAWVGCICVPYTWKLVSSCLCVSSVLRRLADQRLRRAHARGYE